jgi:transposase-like protein
LRGWSDDTPQQVPTRATRARGADGEGAPGRAPLGVAAIGSIASKFGMTSETLRQWVRRAEVDGGVRPGVTSEDKERIRQLERPP